MNKDQFTGKWKEMKGKVKEQWGNLTDDDLTRVNGKRDQMLAILQQRYGYHKEKAEEELKKWEDTYYFEDEDINPEKREKIKRF